MSIILYFCHCHWLFKSFKNWVIFTKFSKYCTDLSTSITLRCREQAKLNWVNIFVYSILLFINHWRPIVNLKESMSSKNWKVDNVKKNIRAINLMIMRLIELSTNFRDANTLDLENPQQWNNVIIRFFQKTENSICQHFLEVMLFCFTCLLCLIMK